MDKNEKGKEEEIILNQAVYYTDHMRASMKMLDVSVHNLNCFLFFHNILYIGYLM